MVLLLSGTMLCRQSSEICMLFIICIVVLLQELHTHLSAFLVNPVHTVIHQDLLFARSVPGTHIPTKVLRNAINVIWTSNIQVFCDYNTNTHTWFT